MLLGGLCKRMDFCWVQPSTARLSCCPCLDFLLRELNFIYAPHNTKNSWHEHNTQAHTRGFRVPRHAILGTRTVRITHWLPKTILTVPTLRYLAPSHHFIGTSNMLRELTVSWCLCTWYIVVPERGHILQGPEQKKARPISCWWGPFFGIDTHLFLVRKLFLNGHDSLVLCPLNKKKTRHTHTHLT